MSQVGSKDDILNFRNFQDILALVVEDYRMSSFIIFFFHRLLRQKKTSFSCLNISTNINRNQNHALHFKKDSCARKISSQKQTHILFLFLFRTYEIKNSMSKKIILQLKEGT